MNFKEMGVQTVEPLAVLEGGINGVKFIARTTMNDGQSQLMFMVPPNYDLKTAVLTNEEVLETAVIKHGYGLVNHKPIESVEEYEEYLREINKANK